MLGSLGEMDLKNARAKQVAIHKKKLNSYVSLQKGGSLLALVGLAWKKDKEVKVAEEALKKAKTVVTRAENKAKDDLYKLGVIDRKEERERKKWVKEQQALQALGVVALIPPKKLVLIRDCEKEPTADEIEAIHIVNQSLYDTIAQEQKALDDVIARDIASFLEVLVNPTILAMEEAFQVQQNPLSQVRLQSDDEEDDEEGYIPSFPLGGMALGQDECKEEEGGNGMDLCSSPPRSVATIDSFDARNQDYIRFS
jgi:hypothetical protein